MSQASHDPFLEAQRARLAGAMAEAAARREQARAARPWLEPGFDFGPPIADSEWTPRHFMKIRPKVVLPSARRGRPPGKKTSEAARARHLAQLADMAKRRGAFRNRHPLKLTRAEHAIALALAKAGYAGLMFWQIVDATGIAVESLHSLLFRARRALARHDVTLLSSGTKPCLYRLSPDILDILNQVKE